jgi:uncharacterized Zn-binding protein involved in type VI secretion
MTKRFHITINAKTTAGGIVTSATHCASANGLLLALEGDSIACPACHSKGRIKCDGPRISSTFNGKENALSDDLCICNCGPPPKLIAIQEHMYQIVSNSPSNASATPKGLTASSSHYGTHDLMFEVRDTNGQPLADCPYQIELPDGTRLEGVTDQNGLTRKVGAMSAELAKLTIYAPEPSPIDPNWDR